jgi:hypothetical protein
MVDGKYLTLSGPALPCHLASLPQVQSRMLRSLRPHSLRFLNDPTMKANSTAGPQWLKRWIEIVELQLKARGVIRPGGSAVIQQEGTILNMVVSLVAGLCYDRLRPTTHHTATAMIAITIMAINTLPMSTLCTVGRRAKPAKQTYSNGEDLRTCTTHPRERGQRRHQALVIYRPYRHNVQCCMRWR